MVRIRLPLLRVVLTAVVVVMLTGCGDSVGPSQPSGPIDITITTTMVSPPAITITPDGDNKIQCAVYLHAVAQGPGRAWWKGAVARFYTGENNAILVDSLLFSAAEIRESWSDSVMLATTTPRARWEFYWSITFGVTMDFYYTTTDGKQKTASVSFSCAPPPPAEPGPPTLSGVSLSAPAILEPGGSVSVTYSASANWGLLKTVVALGGPCVLKREFGEGLQRSVTRTVTWTVPPTCQLGAPFTAFVWAYDAIYQEAFHSQLTSTSVTDRTPPWLRAEMQWRLADPSPTLEGDFFVGDTIRLLVEANDNASLRDIVLEVQPAGYRDSIPGEGFSNRVLIIPVRQGWEGPNELRVSARDAAGMMTTAASLPGAIRVHPTVDRPVQVANVPGDIIDEVIDAKRDLIYLLHGDHISVFSPISMRTSMSIELPIAGTSVDLTPGGDSLVVALGTYPGLAVIDLRQPEAPPTTVPLTGIGSPAPYVHRLRIARNGKVLLMAFASPTKMIEADLATGVARVRNDGGGLTGGGASESLERSADGSTIVMRADWCVRRYDAATDRFDACHDIAYGQLSVDSTGHRVAVGLDVYDSTWGLVQQMPSPDQTRFGGVALSPDGNELFSIAAVLQSVIRGRVSDGEVLDRSPNPLMWAQRIRFFPDGRRLLTMQPNTISIFQLR